MAKKVTKRSGFGIPVGELLQTLKFLRGFAAQKSDFASQTAAYFSGGEVSVHGGVTGARVRTPWQLGEFAAPVERLVSGLAAVEVQGVEEVEVEVTDSNLTWRGGRARGRVGLVVNPIVEFPPSPPSDDFRAVDGVLLAAVDRASRVVARSASWPMLRGVHWSTSGHVMASDGERMTSVRASAGLGVTVPDHLLRALGQYSFKRVARGESFVWFGDESCEVFGQCYAAEFPHQRFESVFESLSARAEKGELPRFDVLADQSAGALLRSVVAAAEAPTYAARVRVTGRGIEVWSESEVGEARVQLETVTPPAAEREFAVNAQYFADAVAYGVPMYVSENAVYAADDGRVFQHAVMLLAL